MLLSCSKAASKKTDANRAFHEKSVCAHEECTIGLRNRRLLTAPFIFRIFVQNRIPSRLMLELVKEE
jgi:hypothetical protein